LYYHKCVKYFTPCLQINVKLLIYLSNAYVIEAELRLNINSLSNSLKHITKYDLAIVGAGPAGMMAAYRAYQCGAKVILLEKNHAPGTKLLMTGKERCNITNAERDPRKFADQFGNNGKFLLSGLHRFGIEETLNFFHDNKLATVIERGNRVFPESNRAADVLNLFMKLLKNNVTLLTDCKIKNFVQKENRIDTITLQDNKTVYAANYLIATGGLSYPQTGSSGDGYTWARQFGHSIVAPQPALTPLLAREKWVKELEGISLKNVLVSLYQNNRKKEARFGEALFTAYGLSGPVILDMSKSAGKLLSNGEVRLFIDFKPALDHRKLENRILRDLELHKNKSIKNILYGFLPGKIVPVFLELTEIDQNKKSHSITKDERKKLRILLKEFPLTVTGLVGFNKSIITTGGVNLKEIEPKTMKSKLLKNLYFAGEILDLDGPTGGFNLQVCWTTGFIAGESAFFRGP
jgi:predicted Rossmann fold flavoprotein